MGEAKYSLAIVCALAGCVVEDTELEVTEEALVACGRTGAYTPYPGSAVYPTGPAELYPWRGEDFEAYAAGTVECASTKARRPHLEVTAGCLDAATVAGRYRRGVVRATTDGAFRVLAIGRTADGAGPIKWTDQGVAYRFHYRAATGTTNLPGFKAFVRYRSEDDLYVASWRLDGVVQIQRKQCGVYTALAVLPDFGPPTAGVWHRLRFDAIGDQLELYLDDELVLTATSSTFTWGTAGIRVDSLDGAYVDDWQLVSG